ncbi:MAG: aminoacyl-tRNA hydrolase [Caldilineaceae bacterium]|nr:aminoacyl-tRNA hydrolase [Caldilineaceae bacterium]MCB0144449.1 aminoacyl-tRNA hydrolase [Caldilineaceae bacterium]MCB9151320.1 aminoacyl-tRNA hydrolase [Caldilineaceae bacterium]
MIQITPNISLDESELDLEFVRSSGPGGQNVNKVATAVQLRFDLQHSPSLPEDVRTRAISLAGKQVTDDGVLIIQARKYRTQLRNRQLAIERLVDLLQRAARPPKTRRKTRPSAAAKAKRLQRKRQRSETKRGRGPVRYDE